MRVDAFDFDLPPERIALRPLQPREAARLLVVRPDTDAPLTDAHVADLPAFLRPGDVVVVNDTKVIPARLDGLRSRAGGSTIAIAVTLIKRRDEARWAAFARPAKRLAPGDEIVFTHPAHPRRLVATVEGRGAQGEVLLAFDCAGLALDAALQEVGHMPLPPYISARRAEDVRDQADYQPVFARHAGSVAAPTASLHFTAELMARIRAAGALFHHVTLHVGPGTFLPVKAEETGAHHMHAEWGEVTPQVADALNRARATGGRILAVGSTATRLLESAATPEGVIRAYRGETDIFITPGYRFRAVDMMMTNFHLPRSTLVMLVAAFAGHEMQRSAYAHAIAAGYRFYSYGDASLLFPSNAPAR